MKRGFLFLLLSFTIIPIVAITFYIILVRSMGTALVMVLGSSLFVVNLANPLFEESARYVAARLSKVSPGWFALCVGGLFGLAEQWALSFSREREYPAEALLHLSILAAPVAGHAVNSVLCAASARSTSLVRATSWFGTAVLLHTLNNNPDLYSRWFTAQTFWITHVVYWGGLTIAAAIAMRSVATAAKGQAAP
jgi:hypothetical protein